MARESTYYGVAAAGAILFLPFYGVSSCALNIQRVDNANATGDIWAGNVIPKVYAYDSSVYAADAPARMYGFPTVDQSTLLEPPQPVALSTALAPVESVNNRALSVIGGALQNGNYTVTRLFAKYLMTTPGCTVRDTVAGFLSVLDGAGQPWAWESWVLHTSNAAADRLYIEQNAGTTSFFQIFIDTTGHLNVSVTAGIIYTSSQAIPLGSWCHVALSSNGAQITSYLNDVAAGPTAYTHSVAPVGIVNAQIGATNTYTQSMYIYGNAVTAATIDRHWLEITGSDYYSGGFTKQGGTMAQGGSVAVVYANNALPTAGPPPVASATGLWPMLLPLQGIGRILFIGGTYQYEIHAEEADV